MRRFYFGLEGEQNVKDSTGLLYGSELVAFKAAQRLAVELAQTRPALQGNTCVMVDVTGKDERYYVSI